MSTNLRMPNVNEVTLAGRLTRDPDLRYTSQGTAVCNLGLAVSRKYKAANGETKEETLFIDGTAWANLAETLAERLSKGRPVIVFGALEQREWTDRESNATRSKIQIRVRQVQELDWPESQGSTGGEAAAYGDGPVGSSGGAYGDDGVPF